MTPEKVAAALRHIASAIENSERPKKYLVSGALKKVIYSIAANEAKVDKKLRALLQQVFGSKDEYDPSFSQDGDLTSEGRKLPTGAKSKKKFDELLRAIQSFIDNDENTGRFTEGYDFLYFGDLSIDDLKLLLKRLQEVAPTLSFGVGEFMIKRRLNELYNEIKNAYLINPTEGSSKAYSILRHIDDVAAGHERDAKFVNWREDELNSLYDRLSNKLFEDGIILEEEEMERLVND